MQFVWVIQRHWKDTVSRFELSRSVFFLRSCMLIWLDSFSAVLASVSTLVGEVDVQLDTVDRCFSSRKPPISRILFSRSLMTSSNPAGFRFELLELCCCGCNLLFDTYHVLSVGLALCPDKSRCQHHTRPKQQDKNARHRMEEDLRT